jgi:hypothetical protein
MNLLVIPESFLTLDGLIAKAYVLLLVIELLKYGNSLMTKLSNLSNIIILTFLAKYHEETQQAPGI